MFALSYIAEQLKHNIRDQCSRLGYAFILILNTGIRLGEALALRENDFDWARDQMTIDTSMSFVKKRDIKEGEPHYHFIEVLPKTKNSRRTLHLNMDAVDAAQRLAELNRGHDFLLSNSEGNLTTPRNFARTFKGILVKTGIQDCGVHTLRHSYASALFRQGIDVKMISELLGHASVEITQDTYIHLLESQKQAVTTGFSILKPKEKLPSSTEGAMIYDSNADRMDIRFDNLYFHGGLHCGTPLEVLLNDQWVPTCIEKADDWFLVGLKGLPLNGLRTRLAA